MAKAANVLSVPDFWAGINAALNQRLLSSKKFLNHPVGGVSAEEYFRQLLREYLPKRYSVDTGFVMDATGKRSSAMDIIIADTFHVPPLCSEPNFKVFAVESVCAVVEVTTSPRGYAVADGKRKSKLEVDLRKLSQVREMGRRRTYVSYVPVVSDRSAQFRKVSYEIEGSPRCYMITSGDEWKAPETYASNFVTSLRAVNQETKYAWVNAALSMKHGLLSFKP